MNLLSSSPKIVPKHTEKDAVDCCSIFQGSHLFWMRCLELEVLTTFLLDVEVELELDADCFELVLPQPAKAKPQIVKVAIILSDFIPQ